MKKLILNIIVLFSLLFSSSRGKIINSLTGVIYPSHGWIGAKEHDNITSYIIPLTLDKSCKPVNFSLDVSIYPNMTILSNFWENECEVGNFLEDSFKLINPFALIIPLKANQTNCIVCGKKEKRIKWVYVPNDFWNQVEVDKEYMLIYEENPFGLFFRGPSGDGYRWTFFFLNLIFSIFCSLTIYQSKSKFKSDLVTKTLLLGLIYSIKRIIFYSVDPFSNLAILPQFASQGLWWTGFLIGYYIFCIICLFWIKLSTTMISDFHRKMLIKFTYFTCFLFSTSVFFSILREVIRIGFVAWIFYLLIIPTVASQTLVFIFYAVKVMLALNVFKDSNRKIVLRKFTMMIIGISISMILFILIVGVVSYTMSEDTPFKIYLLIQSVFEIASQLFLYSCLIGFTRLKPRSTSEVNSSSHSSSHPSKQSQNESTKDHTQLKQLSTSISISIHE